MTAKEINKTLTDVEPYDEYMARKKTNDAIWEAEKQEKKMKNAKQAQLDQKRKEAYAAHST